MNAGRGLERVQYARVLCLGLIRLIAQYDLDVRRGVEVLLKSQQEHCISDDSACARCLDNRSTTALVGRECGWSWCVQSDVLLAAAVFDPRNMKVVWSSWRRSES